VPVAPDTELRLSGIEPTTLPLQPQEFYVLSQMTEVMTYADLKTRCIGVAEFEASVVRLLELGAVTSSEYTIASAEVAQSEAGPTEESPAKESPANESTPQEEISGGDSHDAIAESKVASTKGSGPALRSDQPSRAVEALPEPTGLPDVEPVPEDDSRLERGIALDVDFQRCVLAAVDLETGINAFRVLGIGPTEDQRRIKRAFHALSRKLHPDAYFGQELGGYAPRLEKLFTLAKSSFTTLKESAARDTAMSEWFEDESQRRERAVVVAEVSAEYELGRRKAADRKRSERNQTRSMDRARRRANTNVENREQQVEALRVQAQSETESGRGGEALAILHRAKSMLGGSGPLFQKIEADEKKIGKIRGKEAYSRAVRARKMKSSKEAAALFDEAAALSPTLEYLTEAAISMAAYNPKRAREHAMGALSVLARRQGEGSASAALVGRAHYAAAVAFGAAGLMKSARSAARQAEEYLGDTPDLRALLKSLRVT